MKKRQNNESNIKTCPFCTIDTKRTKIINSKPYTIVILSNPRLVPGHLLVIPKRHVEKLSELIEEEKNELCNTVIEFQEKILLRVSSGCDVRQNYRPFLKEGRLKVDHLHIHLIPREFKDDIFRHIQIFENNLFKELDEKEIKNFLFKKNL
jgi:histidine triad (HIT) family protein